MRRAGLAALALSSVVACASLSAVRGQAEPRQALASVGNGPAVSPPAPGDAAWHSGSAPSPSGEVPAGPAAQSAEPVGATPVSQTAPAGMNPAPPAAASPHPQAGARAGAGGPPPCQLPPLTVMARGARLQPCVASMITDEPELVARTLAALDWRGDKEVILGPLREVLAPPGDWYMIARLVEQHNPAAALALLDLAETGAHDAGLLVEVRLTALRLARQLRDLPRQVELRRWFTSSAMTSGDSTRIRARLVDELGRLGESDLVGVHCDSGDDPSITWSCVIGDPQRLDRYLPAIARLPLLSFSDLGQLRDIVRRQGGPRLSGLHCVGDPAWRPGGAAVLVPSSIVPELPEEVILYSRLRMGAPRGDAVCLLEQAVIGCVRLIAADRPCPVLSSLADYAAMLDSAALEAMVARAIDTSNQLYRRAQRGNRDAAAMLLQLHLMLAEQPSEGAPSDAMHMPQYHVARAYDLWLRGPVGKQFHSLMSPRLRLRICTSDSCEETCKSASRSDTCFASCGFWTASVRKACS